MDHSAQRGAAVNAQIRLMLVAFAVLPSLCWAQADRMPQALEQGRSLATGEASSAASSIRLPSVDSSAETVIPHYNSTADGRYESGRGNPAPAGTQQVINCAAATPEQLSGYAGKACDATNFLSRNASTRPAVTIERTDPLLSNAQVRTSQGRLIGLPSSMISTTSTAATTPDGAQCETVIDPEGTSTETAVCHEQGSLSERTCTVGRVIEVDPAYQYQCRQTPAQTETATCNRILSVTCEAQADGCDTGGIVPGSTQGDMRTWFGPVGGGTYALEFGTYSDNYWSGYGAVFDRTLQFNIADRNAVTQFQLINAAFDDWLLVSINGTVVYVGPYGGDRLEVVTRTTGLGTRRMVQYSATGFGWPELDTSWNIGVNVDLRPYLVTGNNTIFMRTIVAGNGEGAIRISARMACPRNCQDNWINQCTPLEQRAQ